MTTASGTRPRVGPVFGVSLIVVGLVAFLAGLFGMGLVGSWVVWLVGGAATLGGAIGSAHRSRWGFVLLTLGVALLLGSAAYIVLGLLQPDGPACGGTGCVTGS